MIDRLPQYEVDMEVLCTIAAVPNEPTSIALLCEDFELNQAELHQIVQRTAAKHGLKIARKNCRHDRGYVLPRKCDRARHRMICDEYWRRTRSPLPQSAAA